jgi:hypothetical protein
MKLRRQTPQPELNPGYPALSPLAGMDPGEGVEPARIVPRDETFAGKTYEEWVHDFVQWNMSLPKQHRTNAWKPQFQDGGPVHFLLSAPGQEAWTKQIDLPQGKGVLLYLTGMTCTSLEKPGSFGGESAEELEACATSDVLTQGRLNVDGQEIDLSELEVFNVQVPDVPFSVHDNNNLEGDWGGERDYKTGTEGVGYTNSYFVLLEPMAPGKHTVDWQMRMEGPREENGYWDQNASYELNVK